MKTRLSLLLFFFFLLATSVYGQQDLYFRSYQTHQGLSSNTITTIIQDDNGFMWFGTRNGLNRFDGSTFRIFQNDPKDALSIGNNNVTYLARADKKQLWVGTRNGIFKYNPENESFTFQPQLPSGLIQEIHSDSDKNLWLLADGTLYYYNNTKKKLIKLHFNSGYTRSLFLDKNNTVWAIGSDGKIRKYQSEGELKSENSIEFDEKPLLDINKISDLPTSEMLLATQHGIFTWNTKTNSTTKFGNASSAHFDVKIHAIYQFSNSQYWLAAENGLYILDLASGEMQRFQKSYENPYALTDNVVYTVYKDKEGGVWLGTFFGGLNYYSPQSNVFKKYLPQTNKNSISGNIVHEIVADKYGQIWIGTEDAGLNRLDSKTGKFHQYKDELVYSNVHGLCVDDDLLWIGTYDHGLDVMDLRTHKIIKHYDAGNGANQFKSNFVVSIYRTKKGEILIGTWDGLFKYDRKNDGFSPVPNFDFQIQGILETPDETLWAASYGGGLSYFNPKTKAFGKLPLKSTKEDGIISNTVNSIYLDSQNNIWIATERGLTQYQLSTKKFVHFTMNNGLPSNQIFKVAEDNDHILWITTANGLASRDSKTGKIQIFNRANGLPTEQFNYNSLFKAENGTLYLGTVKGLVAFKPSDLQENPFVPPVYISGFEVNNKPIDQFKNKDSRSAIPFTKKIELPHHENNLSIDVAALSYMIPEMNQYAYILEGADQNWTELKNNRRIYYTNLPPGNYVFKVKGSNNSGLSNEKETRLEIVILPPWWASWWAYILYGLIVLGIGGIIFRYYHLALSEKNKRKIEAFQIHTEREIFQAKLNFFTNVAHEIRTPLTLIKLPLEKLLSAANPQENWKSSLEMIQKNTDKLIGLTNQLLDFRKMEANKISLTFTEMRIQHLLQDVFDDFKLAAEDARLAYVLEMPRQPLYAYVDENAFTKILHNLIHNAIKYGKESIEVKLLPFNSEDQHFYIEVRNDGELIGEKFYDKIFEPFYRLKDDNKTEGTGIGLPLSRSLAKLHGGDIEVKVINDKNVFLVSLAFTHESDVALNEVTHEDLEDETPIIAPKSSASQIQILVVEDNREIRNYLQQELSIKYKVSGATNGSEALEYLKANNVQLVISDIMMPIMDGIELCRAIKSELEFSHIPVILLTAKNSLPAKIEGLEAGADAYIEKPFSMDFLLAQAESLLNNRMKVKEFFANSPLSHMKGMAYSRADQAFLEQLAKVIDSHISDSDLDVEKLSSLMHMSRPTLYRKISGLSDLSPNELINLARLKKAAEFLVNGDFKVNEVAMMVGYKSHSNFSRDFQRQFKISPTVYMSNNKGA